MTHPSASPLTTPAGRATHSVVSRSGEMAAHPALSYQIGSVNYCPDCGGMQWFVGRVSAECAHCEAALPLKQIAVLAAHPLFVSRGRTFTPHA